MLGIGANIVCTIVLVYYADLRYFFATVSMYLKVKKTFLIRLNVAPCKRVSIIYFCLKKKKLYKNK